MNCFIRPLPLVKDPDYSGASMFRCSHTRDLHPLVTSRFAFAFRLPAPVTALRAMPGARRVAQGNFTPRPSRNRTGTSRLIRLLWCRRRTNAYDALPLSRTPPIAGWFIASAAPFNPFAPGPFQTLPHSYGLIRPCASPRYSGPGGASTWAAPFPSRRQVPRLRT